MDKVLYNAAEAGHLILTVNDRLSRHLQRSYDLEKQGLGLSAWKRPDILSFTAWFSRCQQQIPRLPIFLKKPQLQYVWEQIINDDIKKSGQFLLHVPQTARRAIQAHQMLTCYGADFSRDQAADDHLAFLRWRGAWREVSAETGWHDSSDIPWLLAEAVVANEIKLPGKIILAGFDEVTPDVHHLCGAFKQQGIEVETWQANPYAEVMHYHVKANDPQDEVSRCARWARRILEQNPSARIAVVAPQMEAYQHLIERTFVAELEPDSLFGPGEESYTFNLSLGRSLDKEEVVFAALRLLRLNRQVEQHEISWLLHTPYIGASMKEGESRARLDRELIRLRRFSWPLSRLSKTLSGLAEKYAAHAPEFCGITETLSKELGKKPKKLPGSWAEDFTLFLHKLGWPGERSLSSSEYQAVQRFKSTLGEFASLDSVAGIVERSEAVRLLARMVSDTDFQAEGKDAPIQVLGELESAGLTFDHLWVLGLHDKAMPRIPSPNPFIPLPVQRRFNMKRADAEREYQFASQVADRLFFSAPEVVLSWPAQEDGSVQRPSPLIVQKIAAMCDDSPEMGESKSPSQLIWQSRPQLETVTDDKGPPISTRKPFSGGTGILKDQALCPFRAFAHYRLRAEQVDVSDIGIDSMSRGTLAHTALELFWEDAGDQKTLLSMTDDALDRQINTAVSSALDRLERERRHDIPAKQRSLEHTRLVSLVKRWLDIEQRRSGFRIMAAEKGQQIKIGDLSIRTRIDRIDELEDGSRAIIDYKTGTPDPVQWLDERITEPQLPVYCLGMPNKEVGAVMFGVVRGKTKECGFRGLAREIDGWPGASSKKIDDVLEEHGWESFDEILSHWEKTLTSLGNSFATGDAAVDPVDLEKSCKYCDLTTLCRISERQSIWQEMS